MSFSFGFAADAGSDDEETAPLQASLPSTAVDGPEVPAAAHKLEDMVGGYILHRFTFRHYPPVEDLSFRLLQKLQLSF